MEQEEKNINSWKGTQINKMEPRVSRDEVIYRKKQL